MLTSRTVPSVAALGGALASLLAPVLLWTTSATPSSPSAPPAPAAQAFATSTAAAPSSEKAARSRDAVVVFGDVRHPQLLTRQRLATYPQQRITATFSARGVPTTRTYTGPLLLDVVNGAEPRFETARSNDQLAFALRIGATDGYRAVVSYGEIDPGFANTPVLLALTEDGVTLERPRLVVPGDARGGRYVTDVSSVGVIDLGR